MFDRENYDLPGQLSRAKILLDDIKIEEEILDERKQRICQIISDIQCRIVSEKLNQHDKK